MQPGTQRHVQGPAMQAAWEQEQRHRDPGRLWPSSEASEGAEDAPRQRLETDGPPGDAKGGDLPIFGTVVAVANGGHGDDGKIDAVVECGHQCGLQNGDDASTAHDQHHYAPASQEGTRGCQQEERMRARRVYNLGIHYVRHLAPTKTLKIGMHYQRTESRPKLRLAQ